MVSLPFLFFSHLGSFHLIGSLKVWQVSSGSLLRSLAAHERQIRGLCTTMDGILVATASQDQKIQLWDAENLNLVATLLGHTDMVYAVTSTADSKVLVSASGDTTVRVWDLKTYRELRSLRGHQKDVQAPATNR